MARKKDSVYFKEITGFRNGDERFRTILFSVPTALLQTGNIITRGMVASELQHGKKLMLIAEEPKYIPE